MDSCAYAEEKHKITKAKRKNNFLIIMTAFRTKYQAIRIRHTNDINCRMRKYYKQIELCLPMLRKVLSFLLLQPV